MVDLSEKSIISGEKVILRPFNSDDLSCIEKCYGILRL